MNIIFHLVPAAYFDSLDPETDYAPRDLPQDGFIHCTEGAEEMARTANRYYKSNPGAHYYLYIDADRVRASVRYDDAARLYPHIYGTLNRDAIVAIRPAARDEDGTFHAPEPMSA